MESIFHGFGQYVHFLSPAIHTTLAPVFFALFSSYLLRPAQLSLLPTLIHVQKGAKLNGEFLPASWIAVKQWELSSESLSNYHSVALIPRHASSKMFSNSHSTDRGPRLGNLLTPMPGSPNSLGGSVQRRKKTNESKSPGPIAHYSTPSFSCDALERPRVVLQRTHSNLPLL